MRKLLRFRLRTLLIVMAVVSTLIAFGPHLWWRWKVNSALEETVSNGPLASNKNGNYAFLLSDQKRVFNRLLAIARTDESGLRRFYALSSMRILSADAASFEIRKQLLPQLITFACDSSTPSSFVVKLAEIIRAWIPKTGVTVDERSQICGVAAASRGEVRVAWMGVLDSIGGRRELELLMDFVDTHDNDQLWGFENSHFRDVLWAGLLPHVDRWIHDPVVADKALELTILPHTSAGRDLLLRLISDRGQPALSRTKAIDQLTQTVVGITLLAEACKDDAFAASLEGLLHVDVQQHLTAELRKVRNWNGEELWEELISGLDPSDWPPSLGETRSAEDEAEDAKYLKRHARLSLDCIRLLTGGLDLTSQDEWQLWYKSVSPQPVKQSDLLELTLDHPEMVELATVLRRLVPYHLGLIPDDCLPLYGQMLHSRNTTLQYRACDALLTYTDSAEAIDVAIELIDQWPPSDDMSIHNGVIAMLQRCFAVNYFWDTDAWRKWAIHRRNGVNGSETVPKKDRVSTPEKGGD